MYILHGPCWGCGLGDKGVHSKIASRYWDGGRQTKSKSYILDEKGIMTVSRSCPRKIFRRLFICLSDPVEKEVTCTEVASGTFLDSLCLFSFANSEAEWIGWQGGR